MFSCCSHSTYLDGLAEEVNDKLQGAGFINISDLCKGYDLPGDFLTEVSRLTRTIKTIKNQNIFYGIKLICQYLHNISAISISKITPWLPRKILWIMNVSSHAEIVLRNENMCNGMFLFYIVGVVKSYRPREADPGWNGPVQQGCHIYRSVCSATQSTHQWAFQCNPPVRPQISPKHN